MKILFIKKYENFYTCLVSHSPFLSIFVSNMLCDADGAISAISSAAVSRCRTNGLAIGDSTNGSKGSSGDIKCARTHCFGSSTSRTDSGLPDLFLSAIGACFNVITGYDKNEFFFSPIRTFYQCALPCKRKQFKMTLRIT